MNLNERRQLKKLCREIQRKKLSDNNFSHNEFNMVVLSIIAVCLLGRLRNNNLNKLYEYDQFLSTYVKEIRLLSNNFPLLSKRLTRIKLVPLESLIKITAYVSQLNDSFDNILSWSYQYLKYDLEKEIYGSSLKEGKKIERSAIGPATQFFTEDYMVKHIVDTAFNNLDIKEEALLSIRIIDPACGAGNFLVYALEKLYKTYVCTTESKQHLLKEILENVLVGYDIDPDLSEIAGINLYLKASSYMFLDEFRFNLSIYTVSHSNEDFGTLRYGDTDNLQVLNICDTLTYSYNDLFIEESFDLVLTNPPFMGKRNMGSNLLNYLKEKYPLSKGDLCAAFLIRCIQLTSNNGIVGVVNQTSWMFLKSFCELRKDILENLQVLNVVDLGSNSFFDISGEKTTVALTLIRKERPQRKVTFVKLKHLPSDKKEDILLNGNIPDDLVYICLQKDLLQNDGCAFMYESTQLINRLLRDMPLYKTFATPMQGTSTGDNSQFIDYSWNRHSDPDWIFVSKGGGYSKWCGLNLYKIKWGKDAEYIREHPGSALRNLKYFKDTELVYSDTGTLGLSVRLLKDGQVFIASGPGIRIHEGSKYAHLAFLNSRTVSYFLRLLSPKFTIAAGYIGKLPVSKSILTSPKLAELGKKCCNLKNSYLSRKLTNMEYVHPDFSCIQSLDDYLIECITQDLKEELERLKIEAEIEEIIMGEYQLGTDDLRRIIDEVGQPTYKIASSEINYSVDHLDSLITSLLNKSCQYNPNKKRRFGTEGVLEDLALSLNVNPGTLYERIIYFIPFLKKLKEAYKNDFIHKACLYIFIQPGVNSMQLSAYDLAVELYKLFPVFKIFELEDWVTNNLWEIHSNAFYNNPLLEKVHSPETLRFRAADNLSHLFKDMYISEKAG